MSWKVLCQVDSFSSANISPVSWDLDNSTEVKQHASIWSESNAHDWVNQNFPDSETTAPKPKFSWAFTPCTLLNFQQVKRINGTWPNQPIWTKLSAYTSDVLSIFSRFLRADPAWFAAWSLMSSVSKGNESIPSRSGCSWTYKAAQTHHPGTASGYFGFLSLQWSCHVASIQQPFFFCVSFFSLELIDSKQEALFNFL